MPVLMNIQRALHVSGVKEVHGGISDGGPDPGWTDRPLRVGNRGRAWLTEGGPTTSTYRLADPRTRLSVAAATCFGAPCRRLVCETTALPRRVAGLGVANGVTESVPALCRP
jgi:hypothetical protein